MLSSSDDFSVATPDETNGQESEFSLVVNLRNEIIKTVKFSVLSQFQKSFLKRKWNNENQKKNIIHVIWYEILWKTQTDTDECIQWNNNIIP